MPIKHLAIIYLIQILLVTLPGFGIARLFKKAGRTDLWKAYVPFLNTWEMQKMTGRKMHWVFWQFIPIVGWFITPGIFIEFVKLFGRFSIPDHTGASLVAPIYMPYIGGKPEVRFIGADIVKKQRKGTAREWFDAAIFAVVAATLIRLFVFEAYVIPTGSMEKTLLVNDYLFVSKMSYGTRVPNTPLSFPFVHHTMPLTSGKSYLQWIKLPYIRWWAKDVKRNDIVVFNLPAGDTVINKEGFQSEVTYYDLLHEYIRSNKVSMNDARREVLNNSSEFPLVIRPVDKRENYVKRCVAIAGDKLQVKEGMLYINDQPMEYMPDLQFWYDVKVKPGTPLDYDRLKKEFDIDNEKMERVKDNQVTSHNNKAEILEKKRDSGWYQMLLTNDNLAKFKKEPYFISATIEQYEMNPFMFPAYYYYDKVDSFDVNNFGPLVLPKKGQTISLNAENIRWYRRAIEVYEKNEITMNNGQYTVNGQPNYTFKMNYYWMMGDNRHNSQDSRFWGYVPEDHIVGKPKLIWMSWEGGPRWKRLFNWIK